MVLTKQILDDYRNKDREIRRIEDKIDYFASYVTPMEHGVVTGSMKDFPFAKCHFVLSGTDPKSDDARQTKLKELIILLQERKTHFFDLEIEVGKAIEEIESPDLRQMIEDKYVRGLTDKEIATKMGYERTTVTKRIKAFLEQNETFTKFTL